MLKLFKNLGKRDWLLMLLSLVFIIAEVALNLTMPGYMADITSLVQTDGSTLGQIVSAGVKMLLCAVGGLVAAVLTSLCSASVSTSFSATLRRKMFARVQDFSMEEIGHFSTASLITRSTNDVTQVQVIITMGLQLLVMAPVMAVMAIMKISHKKAAWTFSTGVAVVLLLLIVGICMAVVIPQFKKIQELTDDLNRITRENLNGLSVVRAYNAEEYQENKFKHANDTLTNINLFAQKVMAMMSPGISLVMSGLSLSIYWIGASLINEAPVEYRVQIFSDMMVFSQYATQVVMSFMMLVMIFMIAPRAAVSAKRIQEVLDMKAVIKDGNVKEGKDGQCGEIVFDRVSFKYPNAEDYVLRDISFTAKKGETVAIIGAIGCGKSTVVNLIPRFYDVTEGAVRIDGVDVKDYEQKALRDKIGYVPQKTFLFGGTIESNISYGNHSKGELSEAELKEALDIAQASEFVDSQEEGSKAKVTQGGTNFSGGQKQRMSIARAIAGKPEILIFDDSFSALDYRTDKALRKALSEKCKDATKIIVAQRIGTIRDADSIIVLEKGKVAGIGKHEELLENCEVYREIALSQLSREELA